MHIGIDLDNTVLDATDSHLHYYNKESGLALTHNDVNDFYLYRMYGWDQVQRNEVYNKYCNDIHWDSVPYPKAAATIQALFKHHQISIITARPLQVQDVTMKWLQQYQIPYHNIALVENKMQACSQLGVDVLIDDGPHYAEEFAKAQKPVILYEQPYNLHITSEWVYRASNWTEVQQQLEYLAVNLYKV